MASVTENRSNWIDGTDLRRPGCLQSTARILPTKPSRNGDQEAMQELNLHRQRMGHSAQQRAAAVAASLRADL